MSVANAKIMRSLSYSKPDYMRAKREADSIISSLKLTARPICLSPILQHFNLKLEYSKNIEYEALLYPKEKKIAIKDDDKHISRKLFSIAHEIGHYVLHSNDKVRKKINYDSDIDHCSNEKTEEYEANAFAIQLLMPENEVINKIIHGYSINQLAEYFGASREFAEFRYNNIIERLY